MTRMTIGELGKKTGLTAKTIRYYESIGLAETPERTENGYRTYPESRVEELRLIKNARELGLPIAQIKKLMVGCENGDCSHSGGYIERELSEYLSELNAKIAQLSQLKIQMQKLKKTVQLCAGQHESKYCCNVLGQIAQQMKGGEDI